jgi:hypothetical protein
MKLLIEGLLCHSLRNSKILKSAKEILMIVIPFLNIYYKKGGSNFEKEVLYEMHRKGLPLPDDGQKIIYNKDNPIAQSDFYYSKRNILLFIDGEPHSKDYVIKTDDKKRRELKNLGYRVYSIHYSRLEDDMQKLAIALE